MFHARCIKVHGLGYLYASKSMYVEPPVAIPPDSYVLYFRLKSKITTPLPTVIFGFSTPPTPNAERTFAMVCLTQSFSVPTKSGWASLHLVTILAVPSPVSSSSKVVSSEKLKNLSPFVRIPSRSHSKRWDCETGKSLAKDSSSKSQGRTKF